MIRKLVLMAALCALAVMALASAASATTLKDSSGTTLASGTTVGTIGDGVIGTAVLTTNLGNLSCTTGGFSGSIGTNNGAATVTGSLTNLAYTTCTDSIPLITVSSCGASSGSLAATTSGAGGNTTTTTLLICQTNIGTCIYHEHIIYVYSNSTHNMVASNQPVTYSGGSLGSGTCGSTATFSATLGPVVVNGTSTNYLQFT